MIEHANNQCCCPGKWCPGCESIVCQSNFHRTKRRADGLQSYCKECLRVKKAAWYQNNPTYSKAHYEANRERYREQHKAWQQNNPERLRTYRRAYEEANFERYREQRRFWERTHPEYRAVRKAKRRAREKNAGGSFTLEQWKMLKAHYKWTCLRCGKREPEITLSADHVVPVSKGGTSDIDNIQPLCLSCNKSKGAKIIDYRPLRD